jgi:hypothetical protein
VGYSEPGEGTGSLRQTPHMADTSCPIAPEPLVALFSAPGASRSPFLGPRSLPGPFFGPPTRGPFRVIIGSIFEPILRPVLRSFSGLFSVPFRACSPLFGPVSAVLALVRPFRFFLAPFGPFRPLSGVSGSPEAPRSSQKLPEAPRGCQGLPGAPRVPRPSPITTRGSRATDHGPPTTCHPSRIAQGSAACAEGGKFELYGGPTIWVFDAPAAGPARY